MVRDARVQDRRAGAWEGRTGGKPISAGGGEAPDRCAEGVMSRPAGEALPQRPHPAPPPQVVPPPRALGVEGPPSGTPDAAGGLPRCHRLTQEVDRSAGSSGPPVPGEGRSARWALAAPRPVLRAPPLRSLPGRGGAGPGLLARRLRFGRPD